MESEYYIYETLKDNSTGRVYYLFPKDHYTAGEAILNASRRCHKKVTDMVCKSAVEHPDTWDVMVSKGDWWCVTRKEGK